jgi:hypothetical protein
VHAHLPVIFGVRLFILQTNFIVETPIPKVKLGECRGKRIGIGKLNNPAACCGRSFQSLLWGFIPVIYDQSFFLKYFYNLVRFFDGETDAPPFIADADDKYFIPLVSMKIFGKPGFEITSAVEAEFPIPDSRFFDNYFFHIGKEYFSVALKKTITPENNGFFSNRYQRIGINNIFSHLYFIFFES